VAATYTPIEPHLFHLESTIGRQQDLDAPPHIHQRILVTRVDRAACNKEFRGKRTACFPDLAPPHNSYIEPFETSRL
jgi:hypothetical protein